MVYPSKLQTRPFRLRYTGIFDFDGLYNMMVQHLKSRRYWFHEDKYKHKVPSPKGAEQEMGFKGERKVNDYIRYDLKVDIHLWDMTEVEVQHKGTVKRLTSARMEIKFQGFVNVDYEKRWEGSNIWRQLKDFYNKYILKEEIESIFWDTMQYKTQDFMNKVKEFLDMEAKGYEYAGYIGDNR